MERGSDRGREGESRNYSGQSVQQHTMYCSFIPRSYAGFLPCKLHTQCDKCMNNQRTTSPLTLQQHVISWRKFVFKIGSALTERVEQGEVGGSTALPDSAWWHL